MVRRTTADIGTAMASISRMCDAIADHQDAQRGVHSGVKPVKVVPPNGSQPLRQAPAFPQRGLRRRVPLPVLVTLRFAFLKTGGELATASRRAPVDETAVRRSLANRITTEPRRTNLPRAAARPRTILTCYSTRAALYTDEDLDSTRSSTRLY
eukprot:1163337-Prymnesium_polylepis.1